MPTIAVFDSGFGGLTVLRALLPLIPGANYLYLGDTARLPYGAKSQQTISRYALSSAAFLLSQGAEMLVVACNTASALALEDLKQSLPIPVIGVIDPGTKAAQALTPCAPSSPGRVGSSPSPATNPGAPSFPATSERVGCSPSPATNPGAPGLASETWVSQAPQILVLATQATVQSHAYATSCSALGLTAHEKACPLLVPLVEEGWINHPVTAAVLKIYLKEALSEAPSVQTLVLGCTHYPLLTPLIERTLQELGHPLKIVDSATATAQAAAALLPTQPGNTAPTCTFYATDSIEKFQRLGSAFLGQSLPKVGLIDLGG